MAQHDSTGKRIYSSNDQEILPPFQKVHYSFQKDLSFDPILSQMNPVHSSISYLLKISFNVTLHIYYAYYFKPPL
jgi:hypothetical protein